MLKSAHVPYQEANRKLPISQADNSYWKFPIVSATVRDMDEYRKKILRFIEGREPPTDLSETSDKIGRNHAYMQQFIHRGTPRVLPEEQRALLAKHLGIDEKELLPPNHHGTIQAARDLIRADEFTLISAYDLRAGAGPGKTVLDERPKYQLSFRTESLKRLTLASADKLFVVTADGDSMEPTLHTGDTVLGDRSQTNHKHEGIYVIRIDNELWVKRLQYNPQSKVLKIISDNDYYPVMKITEMDSFSIIGRVVWMGRRV